MSTPLSDPELQEYRHFLEERAHLFTREKTRIEAEYGSLAAYANLHEFLGMHLESPPGGQPMWHMREYMPAATALWLTTSKTGFRRFARYSFNRIGNGMWELYVPAEELTHGVYYELRVTSPATVGDESRVPAFARWVEQDPRVKEQWCARVWLPKKTYVFRHAFPAAPPAFPRIYEAHVGIAQPALEHSKETVGNYRSFISLLPRIKAGGYNVLQLMGIPEHPLYRSFGYQVSNYFAPSSRFGSLADFQMLVDEAHALGLHVVLDIPHSHACPNTEQSLARYDTSPYFFSAKGNQWGTASFDYSNEMARRFLLSNCRYWLEEFHVDGFRFDAVGNMIYHDHGIDDDFSHVGRCFYGPDGKPRQDENGILYLQLASDMVRTLAPRAITIAEEFSGMPGMTSLPEEGGLGFDYRFAMGIPDFWAKFLKEDRPMGTLWYELTNHRPYENTISYVECHDQCINGKDAMIWRIMGDLMYTHMSVFSDNWKASRAVALIKLMRLVTFSSAHKGWLSFMGNEFGHPEWVDGESFGHRQWHLADNPDLKYTRMAALDQATLALASQYPRAFAASPQFLHVHEENRTLAFHRDDLLFVFNFHETRSQTALAFSAPPGKYRELLSSDEERFAGHNNLNPTLRPAEHFTSPPDHVVSLYLPPMAALVLVRE